LKKVKLIENEKDYDINKIKIDLIYIRIINDLILNKKLEDYNYTYNIIQQMDLESIDLTEIMFNELLEILKNKNNINEYIILNINDLLDIKKINFYYILLKYILKNSFYLYQIPFLLESRSFIIKEIKANSKKFFSAEIKHGSDIESRVIYIIKALTDSPYYYFKFIKYRMNEILNYYKFFYYKSKEEDIKIIEEEIQNGGLNKCEKYLSEFNEAKKMNKRTSIIKYLYDKNQLSNNGNNNNNFDIFIDLWKSLEKNINERAYNKIEIEHKQMLIEYFMNENNRGTLMEIFDINIYDDFIDKTIKKGIIP
jgi:hypothetical protein